MTALHASSMLLSHARRISARRVSAGWP